ncbi:hypothetical protein [Microseira wollei]|nr:hypothetical protein [Microseira wollei]
MLSASAEGRYIAADWTRHQQYCSIIQNLQIGVSLPTIVPQVIQLVNC